MLNTFSQSERVSKNRMQLRSKIICFLALAIPFSLSGCGAVSTNSVQTTPSHAKYQFKVEENVPTEFAKVKWPLVVLPGKDAVSPGMLSTAHCNMALLSPTNPEITYLSGRNLSTLAVVPGWCASYNQSPYNLFVYEVGTNKSAPKLLEVLYQGLQIGRPLTNAVPTASLAALKPYPYSGLFYWKSISVHGTTVALGGLVIPKGKKPPIPYYSEKGLSMATYYYGYIRGKFELIKVVSPGVSPIVPS